MDGGGVGPEGLEPAVDVGVGHFQGALQDGVVREEVEEIVEDLSFFGGADEERGVSGVVFDGFVAGEFFNVAPMGCEPVEDAGAGAMVAEEVDVEEDMVLRADDFGLLEESHETVEVFWLLGEAGDREEEVGF